MDQTGVIAGPHTRVMLAAKAEETRHDSGLSGWSELPEMAHRVACSSRTSASGADFSRRNRNFTNSMGE